MQVINEVTKTAGGSPTTVAGGFNNWGAPYPGDMKDGLGMKDRTTIN